MKKNKIALIGCGRIGYLLEQDKLRKKPCTHWGGATRAGLKINYACDIDIERLQKFAIENNIPVENTYTDYKALLSTIKPELVIIATWTKTHTDIAKYAAKSGCKIIVCEKPIASNLNEALNLIEICKKKDTKLIINHERRYDPKYIKTKELINKKIIGEVKSVYCHIFTGGYKGTPDINNGGGPLLHDGTHIIDLINYFFGPIKTVKGKFKIYRDNKMGFDDHSFGWLTNSKDLDVFIETGGNREYFTFDIKICGTKGEINVGNGYEHIYVPKKSKFYTGFKDLTEKKFPPYKNTNYFTNLYIEAKRLLTNKSEYITSSGIDGYRALEIIHAIYYSSSLNKIVDLPLKTNKIKLDKIFKLIKG